MASPTPSSSLPSPSLTASPSPPRALSLSLPRLLCSTRFRRVEAALAGAQHTPGLPSCSSFLPSRQIRLSHPLVQARNPHPWLGRAARRRRWWWSGWARTRTSTTPRRTPPSRRRSTPASTETRSTRSSASSLSSPRASTSPTSTCSTTPRCRKAGNKCNVAI